MRIIKQFLLYSCCSTERRESAYLYKASASIRFGYLNSRLFGSLHGNKIDLLILFAFSFTLSYYYQKNIYKEIIGDIKEK
jgi:hypothetical protein